ncbi:homeodomain-interacting protein kinase 4 [Strigops habroptila]|uniref:homeodomain-interacting protein kinase 4 n=1 Tax=Strigops habroptila TaxID=2489341 RepID=UPI0011CF7E30|nr:homeodomain-interacting protein kinase 4 [Strigops habroptila]
MGTPTARAELYDVVAAVGKGTFGEVARGRRRSTGEHVAIKILPSTGHRGRVARNELRLLRALRAAGADAVPIVRFLEAFSDASCTYLVLELLQQNLLDFQKLRRFSPLPARHIRTIAAQVLAALVKLEELSIIHADLKPENIMLVDHARFPFRVKLIDFGSGCLVADVAHVKEPYIQSRFYRAPEILLGLPFNERMDVWSLGCVLAELHLGWPLYPGASEYEQVSYICSTLGLPPAELLGAAGKAGSFFHREPHPTGPWQLNAAGEEPVKPMDRRKFVFSSLDQLGTVPRAPEPAERRDRHRMVELLKGMLTWDPLQRLGPSAALRHPFISQEDPNASPRHPGTEDGGFGGRIQAPSTQLDGLSLGEPGGDAAAVGLCQSVIPTVYAPRPRQRRRGPKVEAAARNLIVLVPPGTAAEQNVPSSPYASPHSTVRWWGRGGRGAGAPHRVAHPSL